MLYNYFFIILTAVFWIVFNDAYHIDTSKAIFTLISSMFIASSLLISGHAILLLLQWRFRQPLQ